MCTGELSPSLNSLSLSTSHVMRSQELTNLCSHPDLIVNIVPEVDKDMTSELIHFTPQAQFMYISE